MIIVNATCPTDGAVSLPGDRFSVTDNKIAPEESTYTFTCDKCGEEITKPAGLSVLGLLATATGAHWNVIHVPAELDEPHYGPALTEQDVADFVIDLGLTPDNLIAVLAGGDK